MASQVSRWPYFLVSAVGLVVYLWGASAQMRVAALPDDFPIGRLSYPVRIGEVTAGSPGELDFLVQGVPVGSRVRIVEPDGSFAESTLVSRFSLTHALVTYVSGLIFWLVSVSFFAPRIDRRSTRTFFWATFCYGLAIMIGGVFHPSSVRGPEILLPVLRIFAIALVVAFFVRLSLEFPREHAVLREQRLLVPVLFAIPSGVALWYSMVVLLYVREPVTARWSALTLPGDVSKLLFVAYFLAGVLLLYQSGRRAGRSRDRDQVKWIFWGIGIGAVPFVFLWTLPEVLGLRPWIPLETTRLFSISCPLAFALAIVRHQFLDIDVIIRRSLIYAGLAGAMVFVYFLIGVWLGGIVGSRFPQVSRIVGAAAIVVPVILFGPTRRWIGRLVDRSLFEIRDTHQRAIRALERRFRKNVSHQDVVRTIHETIRDVLRPRRCAVLVRHRGRSYRSGDPERRIDDRAFVDFAEWFLRPNQLVAVPSTTAVEDVETERFPARYRELEYALAMPVGISEDCRGLVLVGQPETERRYLEPDLDFLTAVGAQVRVALEKVGLVERVAEESMARSQLDELNRMKTEFLSRVAHDFRTPLTSIRWSTQNLLDGVAGEMSPDQKECLNAIHASAGHLSRLVNDLLEIGRLEEGRAEIRTSSVDLGSIVESSMVTLGPIATAKGVRLTFRSESSCHPSWADADMMLAVVNNLVENAIRFAPKDTEVEIRLGREGPWQRLTVRDHGPGVPEEDREAIFDRFRQSRPAKDGPEQGFGLGLYVVRSFLAALEGKVWVEDHPEGGATFVCLIPAPPERSNEGEHTDR